MDLPRFFASSSSPCWWRLMLYASWGICGFVVQTVSWSREYFLLRGKRYPTSKASRDLHILRFQIKTTAHPTPPCAPRNINITTYILVSATSMHRLRFPLLLCLLRKLIASTLQLASRTTNQWQPPDSPIPNPLFYKESMCAWSIWSCSSEL